MDVTSFVLEAWRQEAESQISYVWQKNDHKKTAFNRGVRLARGELFLPADSDDVFPSIALERFVHHRRAIRENEQQLFVGVSGLCQDELSRVVGDAFSGTLDMDSGSLEIR